MLNSNKHCHLVDASCLSHDFSSYQCWKLHAKPTIKPPEFTSASASPLRPLMMDGFSFSSRHARATHLCPDWNYFSPAAVCASFFIRHKNEGGVERGWAQGVLSGHRPQVFSGSCITVGTFFQQQDCQTAINAARGRWSIILTGLKGHELNKRINIFS